ncbi:DUF4034 domain-containing protein [Lysobacter sp. BMK333-48F3]|uniref:tetratricopeptide repeat protein n=1 Tax=Lysobacter sp. BMK333-48F3 TaxID=2867962 RepID=UPI001C8B23DD|nr:DUF4034 domain-containing protein [Lysobacter sp. BMK333-48F3]MBX9402772.1 DUF4034 domain-containing protein [Lysobacter sp. BMK333-48F3]
MKLAFSLAAALALSCQAAFAAPAPIPPQWADYVAKVRAADAIADDEARCKAYPDLPGNQWRPGAAQARCGLLRKPALSLTQVEALLGRKDGVAELDRRYARLLDEHYREPGQREQIFRSLDAFDESEQAGRIARRWLDLAPDSAYAHAAWANHHQQLGWNARGGGTASETGPERFGRMQAAFDVAIPEFRRALELEPRLSVACYELAAIGRQISRELHDEASDRCLSIDPYSYYVVYERIQAAQPNWGGSIEEMREAVAYAERHVTQNPLLGAVLGEAEGFPLSRAGSGPNRAEPLAAVVRMAPSGTLAADAGRAYGDAQDYWTAFAYSSQATRFWPSRGKYRAERGWWLRELGDYEWAARDYAIAVAQDPDNEFHANAMADLIYRTRGAQAARPYYAKLIDGEMRFGSLPRYCESFVVEQPMPVEAMRCVDQLLSERPDAIEGMGLRAKALFRANDPAATEAIDRYLAEAPRIRAREWNHLTDEIEGYKREIDTKRGAK